MNHIWEAYLLRTIQRLAPAGWAVRKPPLCVFWEDATGYKSRMQPDILLEHPAHGTLVLDAKWKRPHGKPAEADLRQLFAYAQHFGATRARLLYPQTGADASVEGAFVPRLFTAATGQEAEIQGGVSYLRVAETGLDGGYLHCSLEQELTAWLPVASAVMVPGERGRPESGKQTECCVPTTQTG